MLLFLSEPCTFPKDNDGCSPVALVAFESYSASQHSKICLCKESVELSCCHEWSFLMSASELGMAKVLVEESVRPILRSDFVVDFY